MATESQRAWVARVLGAYEAKLLRYAADVVGPALAADVVQDTFLKLCREDRARVEPHLAAWLFTVCRHGALEVRRKVKRLDLLEPETRESGAALVSDALERGQLLSRVSQVLAALPERERELVRLKFDGELSYKQIAEVTGLSVSNVGFILHTAISRMRAALADELDVPHVAKQGRAR